MWDCGLNTEVSARYGSTVHAVSISVLAAVLILWSNVFQEGQLDGFDVSPSLFVVQPCRVIIYQLVVRASLVRQLVDVRSLPPFRVGAYQSLAKRNAHGWCHTHSQLEVLCKIWQCVRGCQGLLCLGCSTPPQFCSICK